MLDPAAGDKIVVGAFVEAGPFGGWEGAAKHLDVDKVPFVVPCPLGSIS